MKENGGFTGKIRAKMSQLWTKLHHFEVYFREDDFFFGGGGAAPTKLIRYHKTGTGRKNILLII